MTQKAHVYAAVFRKLKDNGKEDIQIVTGTVIGDDEETMEREILGYSEILRLIKCRYALGTILLSPIPPEIAPMNFDT